MMPDQPNNSQPNDEVAGDSDPEHRSADESTADRQGKDAQAKFLESLPLFIHFFFALTVGFGFQKLAETLRWPTDPSFQIHNASDLLVPLSFGFATFWVVTDWIAWTWLIQRNPYTLGFHRFFLDVLSFSLIFAAINFSFLVDRVVDYHYFIGTLALWHAVIVVWHWFAVSFGPSFDRQSRISDANWHAARAISYAILAITYFFAISSAGAQPCDGGGIQQPCYNVPLYYLLVALTFALIFGWSVHRLSQIKRQAKQAV